MCILCKIKLWERLLEKTERVLNTLRDKVIIYIHIDVGAITVQVKNKKIADAHEKEVKEQLKKIGV